MISQDQADKIVAANNLRDAVELLGGTMAHREILDTKGHTAKQIVITYNEKRETKSTS